MFYEPEVDTLLAVMLASEENLQKKLELDSARAAVGMPLGPLGLLPAKLLRREAVTWLPVVENPREPSSFAGSR